MGPFIAFCWLLQVGSNWDLKSLNKTGCTRAATSHVNWGLSRTWSPAVQGFCRLLPAQRKGSSVERLSPCFSRIRTPNCRPKRGRAREEGPGGWCLGWPVWAHGPALARLPNGPQYGLGRGSFWVWLSIVLAFLQSPFGLGCTTF